jgi:hypothetical protein
LFKAAKKESGPANPKLPVPPDMIRKIMADLDTDREVDRVLRASIVTMYSFLLRRSEAVATELGFDPSMALLVGDVVFYKQGVPLTSNFSTADEVLIVIKGSKTDQQRQGVSRSLYKEGHDVCVVTVLGELYDSWVTSDGSWSRGLEEPLFGLSNGSTITGNMVSNELKRAAVEMGQDEANYATHSLRIGGCTALLASNMDSESVRRFGRWRSDCWRQYAYDTREAMRGVSTRLAATDYSLEHASLDFLAARREVNRTRLEHRPNLRRQEEDKISAAEAKVRRRARTVARPKPMPPRQAAKQMEVAKEPVKFVSGYEFRKEFSEGWFTGKVIGYQFPHKDEAVDAPIYYKILYEDGDQEMLTAEEVQECQVVLSSSPMRARNSTNRKENRRVVDGPAARLRSRTTGTGQL